MAKKWYKKIPKGATITRITRGKNGRRRVTMKRTGKDGFGAFKIIRNEKA